jgi:succinate dehydrogenase / fumarate reductase, membrane anchor subunit
VKLATPLGRVLGLGSAKGGTGHWWVQRLTAIALLPLGLWLALSLASFSEFSYPTLVNWIQQPLTSVLLLLTVLVIVYHSHLGIQVVVEDYTQGKTKVSLLILSAFGHAFLGVAGAFSILKVAFGTL